jgi:hypothetical protein
MITEYLSAHGIGNYGQTVDGVQAINKAFYRREIVVSQRVFAYFYRYFHGGLRMKCRRR